MIKKTTLQLHALPEEIVDFLRPTVNFGATILLIQQNPFTQLEISIEELQVFRSRCPSGIELYLVLCRPNFSLCNLFQLADYYSDHVEVYLHYPMHGIPRQSSVSTIASSPLAGKIWNKLVVHIRKNTIRGVNGISCNPIASVSFPSFRHTQGARNLESSGYRMLPFAGNTELRLIDRRCSHQ